MKPNQNPGSFRDPGGQIFEHDGQVLRTVQGQSAKAFEAFKSSGLLDQLVDTGKLVGAEELDPATYPFAQGASYLLKHPRIPFISYPYEWSFRMLKRAALFHLDLQMEALEAGFTLSDATAYNVQFVATEPVFIDHLSFRPYVAGEIWQAHRQFCMQFLNPLVLWSRKGISPNTWFRGNLEGISPEDLALLLSWKDNFSWTILTHVSGQAAIQRRAISGNDADAQQRTHRLSRVGFKGMLEGLRSFIQKLELDGRPSVWGDYEQHNSYEAEAAEKKRSFVAKAFRSLRPRSVIDLGCNAGEYCEVALSAGADMAIGFDFDFGALDAAVVRADEKRLNLLPLWLDAANPSPDQGWGQAERSGFARRAQSDFVMALAFVHHLAIARNVPLGMLLDWIMSIAPVGIIEFPPKSDPMVQSLLANREDIFAEYDDATFLRLVGDRARIVEQLHLTENGRLLVLFERT